MHQLTSKLTSWQAQHHPVNPAHIEDKTGPACSPQRNKQTSGRCLISWRPTKQPPDAETSPAEDPQQPGRGTEVQYQHLRPRGPEAAYQHPEKCKAAQSKHTGTQEDTPAAALPNELTPDPLNSSAIQFYFVYMLMSGAAVVNPDAFGHKQR